MRSRERCARRLRPGGSHSMDTMATPFGVDRKPSPELPTGNLYCALANADICLRAAPCLAAPRDTFADIGANVGKLHSGCLPPRSRCRTVRIWQHPTRSPGCRRNLAPEPPRRPWLLLIKQLPGLRGAQVLSHRTRMPSEQVVSRWHTAATLSGLRLLPLDDIPR